MVVSRRCSNIVGSLTLEIDAKAKAMKAEGLDVIGFGAGEPDYDTPAPIVQAAKEALDKGLTRYTPASGTVALREAICERYKTLYGVEYSTAQVVVSNGAKHALFNACQAILDPGDEVILPAPYWLTYPELVKMADGVPVIVDTLEENGFKLTLEQFKAAITDKTRALIICNPSNPTGSIYARVELMEIAGYAAERGIVIISDEVYEELVYDGEMTCIASLSKEIYENTITVSAVSKTYAMTGWRIGYTLSPQNIAKAMGNFQSHSTSNPNSIAQYASCAALKLPKDSIEHMRLAFDKRRKLMFELINAIDGLSCLMPGGAFYMMMNIQGLFGKEYNGKPITGSMDFTAMLLEAQQVAVVPGLAFGADGFVRMSYATGETNIENGIARIAEFCKSLK